MVQSLIEKFNNVKVLVVGDVMLDRYWWGSVSRISPEAPVPVVRLENRTLSVGGAANVAANIVGLGATALLVGLVGDDDGGRELSEELEKIKISPGHLIKLSNRPTTVKTRIVAHHQHIVRIDDENVSPLSADEIYSLKEHALNLLASIDVLLLSDYAKGTITQELLTVLIETAKAWNIPVLIDPKGRDYKRYEGASVLTPNRKEALNASGLDLNEPHDINEIGRELLANLRVNSLLVTLGEDGMALFRRDESPLHLEAVARDVYDVTGAGDTVIATLSVAIGAGANLPDAARLANIAAGIVVEQVGTTAIDLETLKTAIESEY
jgi:D-beta-D-heptose 7-phosphate kinase/D-beta-D-heptose 1-phosphate adenosyltransferase